MWRTFALPVCLFLSGCSSFEFFSSQTGVGVPSPSVVRDYQAETVLESTGSTTPMHLTAGRYIIASVGYTNNKCLKFFDLLEKFKQDSELVDKVITAGIAAGAPLLALAGVTSGADVARITSELALGNQVNKYASDIYAFNTFREQLKGHVLDSMDSFQKKKGIDLFFQSRVGILNLDAGTGQDLVDITLGDGSRFKGSLKRLNRFLNSEEPEDLMIARDVASDYASLCSLASMRKIVVEALASTKTGISGSGAGAPTNTATSPKTTP